MTRLQEIEERMNKLTGTTGEHLMADVLNDVHYLLALCRRQQEALKNICKHKPVDRCGSCDAARETLKIAKAGVGE